MEYDENESNNDIKIEKNQPSDAKIHSKHLISLSIVYNPKLIILNRPN